jgi:hypothetical protein
MRRKNPRRYGFNGERAVLSTLRRHGHAVEHMPGSSHFDLLVDGNIRVDVKTASPQMYKGRLTWFFGIHHPWKTLADTDIYILRLEKLPFYKGALHLLLKAPFPVQTIHITINSLLTTYSPLITAFEDFKREHVLRGVNSNAA